GLAVLTTRPLPHLARRLARLVVLVVALVATRHLVGVWASSVAMSALFMWWVLWGLRRLDTRSAPARSLVPEVIPPPRRPPSAGPDTYVSTPRRPRAPRVAAVVAVIDMSDCDDDWSMR
ncbi:MAG: hypothetical protein ACRDYV_15680, partial [Acidimicrobiia bacterium]